MFPGMNPRKMQQMMRQLGIQQQDIAATEVIIRLQDKELIITNPSVAKVNMMGQETFQISGQVEERKFFSLITGISEEDIKTVMEQAGVDKETAKKALEKHQGDLAEAILGVKKE
ncbi:nascent polypeptide-associated complex protein [Candidatus Woesearchaeota archaeon]|nr:nascent polypeptide-associated complex protein [Candidatus Woesearchaeota archaeon]